MRLDVGCHTMRRLRWLLLIGVVVPAAAFAQQSSPPAPPAGRPSPGLITTHAESKRRLPNTVSDAVVSIEVHGRDLRGTASALGRQSQALLTFLRGQPTERLRTDGMSFNPETQEVRNQPDRIKGYTGKLTVSFRTTPDQLAMLLAGCLDNGATGLGQFGSSPREQEVEAARQEMVAEAGQSALAQARAIATAAGQRIAGVEFVRGRSATRPLRRTRLAWLPGGSCLPARAPGAAGRHRGGRFGHLGHGRDDAAAGAAGLAGPPPLISLLAVVPPVSIPVCTVRAAIADA